MPHGTKTSNKNTSKRKFFVGSPTGGEEVTREEFASIRGAGPSAKGGPAPQTDTARRIIEERALSPEQRVLAEIEQRIKERDQTQTDLPPNQTPIPSVDLTPAPPEQLTVDPQQTLIEDTPEEISLLQDIGQRLGIPGFGTVDKFVDPFTGKVLTDPETGEPVKAVLGTAPLGPAKIGMLKALATGISKKIGTVGLALFLGQVTLTAGLLIQPFISKKVTAVDRQIQSLDTGLSQIRETITAPVQLVASGLPALEGLDMLDQMEQVVLETEKKLKELELNSQELKTNPEFTFAIRNRIKKLKLFIQLSERQIIRQDITGRVPTTQELASLVALLGPANISR